MLKLYGTHYGGFFYTHGLFGIDEDSIVYCVGAGEDISHDVMVSHKTGCKVFIIDPTPRAVQHVKYIKDIFNGKAKPIENSRFGGGDKNYLNFLLANKVETSKMVFLEYAVGKKNGEEKFYIPTNTNYVSHSLVKGMKSNKFINVQVRTLKCIMDENGHEKIDLLKMDIEGSECDVIDTILDENIRPKYMAIEFDLGWHGEKIKDRKRCLDAIDKIKSLGYSILHDNRPEITFIRNDILDSYKKNLSVLQHSSG